MDYKVRKLIDMSLEVSINKDISDSSEPWFNQVNEILQLITVDAKELTRLSIRKDEPFQLYFDFNWGSIGEWVLKDNFNYSLVDMTHTSNWVDHIEPKYGVTIVKTLSKLNNTEYYLVLNMGDAPYSMYIRKGLEEEVPSRQEYHGYTVFIEKLWRLNVVGGYTDKVREK